jgi:hypothetical protein
MGYYIFVITLACLFSSICNAEIYVSETGTGCLIYNILFSHYYKAAGSCGNENNHCSALHGLK